MSLILSLIAFLIMSNQFEQTLSRSITRSVTLWLFGAHRLDSGQSTLPLQPQGTAINGLSTTYLYEVASPVTTIVDVNGSPEFSVSFQGWGQGEYLIFHFWMFATSNANNSSLRLWLGRTFWNNRHYSITQTNSGTPTPVVLAVSTAAPVPAFTTSFPTQTLPTPNSATSPTDSDPTTTSTPSHNLSAGAIAGVTIGVTLAVFVLVVLVLLLFRRRQRRLAEGERAKGITIETYEPFSYPQTIANAQGLHESRKLLKRSVWFQWLAPLHAKFVTARMRKKSSQLRGDCPSLRPTRQYAFSYRPVFCLVKNDIVMIAPGRKLTLTVDSSGRLLIQYSRPTPTSQIIQWQRKELITAGKKIVPYPSYPISIHDASQSHANLHIPSRYTPLELFNTSMAAVTAHSLGSFRHQPWFYLRQQHRFGTPSYVHFGDEQYRIAMRQRVVEGVDISHTHSNISPVSGRKSKKPVSFRERDALRYRHSSPHLWNVLASYNFLLGHGLSELHQSAKLTTVESPSGVSATDSQPYQ
ncbi:hypothetical protein EV360DRAFT_67873 [Lentinula raphanica]|nr:hypothetical protein EV360DRAFT_67873 [Lentinula raphanica]